METPARSADVVVVGLGAMGSHALWRLAKRGARVIGVEQFTPGHDRGSSHGESRVIRTAYSEGPGYVPLVLHAWRLWDELEGASGRRLLERCGGLTLGGPDSPMVRGALASAAEHGLRHELLSSAELRQRFPQHRVDDDTIGFYEVGAGVIRPELGVVEAVRAAQATGAKVLEAERVVEVLPDPERPAVRLAGRTLEARHVVLAGGAWMRELVKPLEPQLRVVRRVQAWFQSTAPGSFSPRVFPVFVRNQPGGGSATWYGCPSLDASSVKLALHDWPGIDEPVDPSEGPRPPDDADAERLTGIVAATLPELRPWPVRMKACMYSLTHDQHFAVGQRRDLPGITLLAGFSGHGYKFAPVLGEAAAQLALNGVTDLPIEAFDPHRFDDPPV